jgi:hypothetical protein
MDKPEGKKVPWECPTITLAGTIALLVRGGSAQGKGSGLQDGDATQFQCNPPNFMCRP